MSTIVCFGRKIAYLVILTILSVKSCCARSDPRIHPNNWGPEPEQPLPQSYYQPPTFPLVPVAPLPPPIPTVPHIPQEPQPYLIPQPYTLSPLDQYPAAHLPLQPHPVPPGPQPVPQPVTQQAPPGPNHPFIPDRDRNIKVRVACEIGETPCQENYCFDNTCSNIQIESAKQGRCRCAPGYIRTFKRRKCVPANDPECLSERPSPPTLKPLRPPPGPSINCVTLWQLHPEPQRPFPIPGPVFPPPPVPHGPPLSPLPPPPGPSINYVTLWQLHPEPQRPFPIPGPVFPPPPLPHGPPLSPLPPPPGPSINYVTLWQLHPGPPPDPKRPSLPVFPPPPVPHEPPLFPVIPSPLLPEIQPYSPPLPPPARRNIPYLDSSKPIILYQLYHLGKGDHFYSINEGEIQNAQTVTVPPYTLEGTAGFCVTQHGACGATWPLHRFYSKDFFDHLYITDEGMKRTNTTDLSRYVPQGTECYVWPHHA